MNKPTPVHVATYSGASTVLKGFWCGLCGAHAATQDANATFAHTCSATLKVN